MQTKNEEKEIIKANFVGSAHVEMTIIFEFVCVCLFVLKLIVKCVNVNNKKTEFKRIQCAIKNNRTKKRKRRETVTPKKLNFRLNLVNATATKADANI